jgi:hypothetical protein
MSIWKIFEAVPVVGSKRLVISRMGRRCVLRRGARIVEKTSGGVLI